ncbi:hypothetical protein ACP70R_031901 [Stipagrostis hirtigluma subsp. patula]
MLRRRRFLAVAAKVSDEIQAHSLDGAFSARCLLTSPWLHEQQVELHCNRRWLRTGGGAGAGKRRSKTYAKRIPSLRDPLPGLKLPPALHGHGGRPPPPPARTQVTTLPNGVRVASQDTPGPMACVGVVVDSGSAYETQRTAGVSHLLERLAFHDTKNRSLGKIERDVEAAGMVLSASAGRERTVYTCDAFKAYLPQAVEVLLDCIRNPVFVQSRVEDQLGLAQDESRGLKNSPEVFLDESLHTVGYSGALGNPRLPPVEALARIDRSIISKFYYENYTADRLVLAASGVNHKHFLSIAEPLLSDLSKGPPVDKPNSTYVGGDFRHRTDSEMTHVALGFEVPGGWRQEKQAIVMTVLQALMGGGSSLSSGGLGKGLCSRLFLRVLYENVAIKSISAFSSIYDDTGIFGIRLTTKSIFVAKAVDFALKELTAIATPSAVTEVELSRAKNSAISSILTNQESRRNIAEDIGWQILTSGHCKPCNHFLERIEEITLADITLFAQKLLSSRPTLTSWGDSIRSLRMNTSARGFSHHPMICGGR